MRTLIRLVLVILVTIVAYNYFFGDSSEKSESREIVEQAKELVGRLIDLVKNEKVRMEHGKYDGLFRKLESAFGEIRSALGSASAGQREELNRLEQEKDDLEKKIKDAEENDISQREKERLENKIGELLEKADKLLENLRK